MLRGFRQTGFSVVELLIVLGMILVVTVLAVPSLQNTFGALRGGWAARGLSAQLYLARMRAGARFAPTRLRINPTTNTFRLEVYDKTASTYQEEGGTQYLGSGVSFGYGSIATPAGSQAVITQSLNVIFNSRGIPVDASGAPTGNDAIYLNNAGRFYAVTLSIVGQVVVWRWSSVSWQPL